MNQAKTIKKLKLKRSSELNSTVTHVQRTSTSQPGQHNKVFASFTL
jgi:hypothetical protein